MRIFNAKNFIGLILFMVFHASEGMASYSIVPIVHSFKPSGREASTVFTVTSSTEKRKIPIQLYIVAREPNEKGEEVYKEDPKVEELFQIYPSQLILGPKESKSVKVTWIGQPKVKQELSFRLIVEEMPFDVDAPRETASKATASVNFSTRYVGSLYVTPENTESKFVVKAEPYGQGVEASAVSQKSVISEKNRKVASQGKADQILVKITNLGSVHHVFKDFTMELSGTSADKNGSKNSKIILNQDNFKQLVGQNILAGKARNFLLPWPSELPVGDVSGSMKPGDSADKR